MVVIPFPPTSYSSRAERDLSHYDKYNEIKNPVSKERAVRVLKFPIHLLIGLIFFVGYASALDLLEVSQNLNIKKERGKNPEFCSFAIGKKGNPPKSSANRIACYKGSVYSYNTRKSQELTMIVPQFGAITCSCNKGKMIAKVEAASLFAKLDKGINANKSINKKPVLKDSTKANPKKIKQNPKPKPQGIQRLSQRD